jgi:hypothetical protein
MILKNDGVGDNRKTAAGHRAGNNMPGVMVCCMTPGQFRIIDRHAESRPRYDFPLIV